MSEGCPADDGRGDERAPEGTFTLSGLAGAGGDLAFGAVVFARRLDSAPTAAGVTLTVDAAENVPNGGVAVMADGGFAPSAEGMTLVVAAGGPGRFVVRGRYAVTSPAQ